jgi:drug/metabolite transporter (DMT)-like permease
MELKWILAIALEASFWLMLAAFLVLRYRYGMENITRLFVIGVVIDTAGIVALGVWDFVSTGHVNTYTAFIAALVLYGVTSGKQHFAALDRWMARRIKPKRGRQRAASRPLPERC